MDKNSLSHTTWNCKYHIVFAPKYRRQINLWKDKGGEREDTANAVREERCGDNRGRGMPGPYPHAGQYTAKVQRVRVYGILEGKEFADDI